MVRELVCRTCNEALERLVFNQHLCKDCYEFHRAHVCPCLKSAVANVKLDQGENATRLYRACGCGASIEHELHTEEECFDLDKCPCENEE